MPRPMRLKPASSVPDWPRTVSDQPDVEVARQFVLNLEDAIEGRSLREIQEVTGVNYVAIGNALRGISWPDMSTIAKLEAGLRRDLWPVGVARRQGRSGLRDDSAE